ncbi:hypothetical protein BKA65DRAFT_568337 [Rhexocercosporidium sp. MPI-PUGE-AT-0058]|nr:hypothetical protein BKA65DRAFT_568337 [Rhexocercosporidium sp. MPI-PUGE-AT-0058]
MGGRLSFLFLSLSLSSEYAALLQCCRDRSIWRETTRTLSSAWRTAERDGGTGEGQGPSGLWAVVHHDYCCPWHGFLKVVRGEGGGEGTRGDNRESMARMEDIRLATGLPDLKSQHLH